MAYPPVVSGWSAFGLSSVSPLSLSIIIRAGGVRNVFSPNRLDQLPAPDRNATPVGNDSTIENDFCRGYPLDLFPSIPLLEMNLEYLIDLELILSSASPECAL